MRREAKLKPEAAHLYPSLDPEMWYTAAALTGFVKGTRLLNNGIPLEDSLRLLDPEHFEFRGGSPRRGSFTGMLTRWLDRHSAHSGSGR
jgi:hypothetical protein